MASAAPSNGARPFTGASMPVVTVVVFTVRAAVAPLFPPIVTEPGMLQVGGSVGFDIVVLTAHDRFTVPVKPPEGAKVMVAVPDPPGVSVMLALFPLPMVNPAEAFTVIEMLVEDLIAFVAVSEAVIVAV